MGSAALSAAVPCPGKARDSEVPPREGVVSVWYVPQSEPGAGDQKNAAPPAGDEKMEVDQIADGAGDASNAQPPSEPRQSLKDALKKMAAETDFLGFTPLLRACQVCFIYYTNIFSLLVWTRIHTDF